MSYEKGLVFLLKYFLKITKGHNYHVIVSELLADYAVHEAFYRIPVEDYFDFLSFVSPEEFKDITEEYLKHGR